jgi:hypothetical protein
MSLQVSGGWSMAKPSQAGDSLPTIPRRAESHVVLASAF